jgi:hypothetical protein
MKGLNSHLKTASQCRHWGKGKRREISDILLSESRPAQPSDVEMDLDWDPNSQDNQDTIQEVLDIWDDEEGGPYHFVEEYVDVEVRIREAGPGPSSTHQCHADPRILDEQDDKLITDWNERAGWVIHMDERLHVRWQKLFLHDDGKDTSPTSTSNPPPDNNAELNPYAPFASELDWRIAKWVVKDKIGHKSFDRFLTIPGVCPLSGVVESLLTLSHR